MEGISPDPANSLKQILLQRLESLQRAGVTQLRRTRANALAIPQSSEASIPAVPAPPSTAIEADSTMAKSKPRVTQASAAASAAVRPPSDKVLAAKVSAEKAPADKAMAVEGGSLGPILNRQARLAAFDAMREEVAACTKCSELAATRTQTVFGVGNIQPRVCFFGEAPGADEDRQGEPFVGRAGQLLNKIMEASQMKRDDVFILNTLKCRPPGNRTPSVEEVGHCRHFFERQIEILRPEFIVCLGTVAAQSLLRTSQATGKLRGQFHDYRGIRVLVTYHPAYLLRNPNAKKDVWEDMKILMREMGLEVPKTN